MFIIKNTAPTSPVRVNGILAFLGSLPEYVSICDHKTSIKLLTTLVTYDICVCPSIYVYKRILIASWWYSNPSH